MQRICSALTDNDIHLSFVLRQEENNLIIKSCIKSTPKSIVCLISIMHYAFSRILVGTPPKFHAIIKIIVIC